MSDIILGVLLGICVTFLFVYWYVRGLVMRVMKDIDNHIEKAVATLLPIRVERVNNEIYCYSKEDNQFLCQGRTAVEIRDALRDRYPERTAYIDEGEEELVNELKAQLKELHKPA